MSDDPRLTDEQVRELIAMWEHLDASEDPEIHFYGAGQVATLADTYKELLALREQVAEQKAKNARLRAGEGLSADGIHTVVARWHGKLNEDKAQRCENCGMIMLDTMQNGTMCRGCGVIEIVDGRANV